MAYKKRLRSHLTETRDHKRRVAQRIKQLGGTLDDGPPRPLSPAAAGKTLAAIKGQVGALHAAVSDQAETHLRNAQEELREEHVEIALYNRIETFALEVGDPDTAKLAAGIRRDETRMAGVLGARGGEAVRDVCPGRGPAGAAPQAAGGPFTRTWHVHDEVDSAWQGREHERVASRRNRRSPAADGRLIAPMPPGRDPSRPGIR